MGTKVFIHELLQKPDYGKPKFTVTVTAYQSCSTINVTSHDGTPISYHDLIGVLDVSKTMLIQDVSNNNRKEYAKQLRAKRKIANSVKDTIKVSEPPHRKKEKPDEK